MPSCRCRRLSGSSSSRTSATTKTKLFGNRTTYRVAPALLVPFTETKLKGSIGTGFKAPTLSQLYSDFRPVFNFVGNPNLLPEESIGYDFGFEQPLFNDRFRFGLTRYNIEI